VSFRFSNLLAAFFVLFAASAVNAAPTVRNCSAKVFNCAMSTGTYLRVPVLGSEITQVGELSDSRLAAVGAEFLEPPAIVSRPTAAPAGAKSLPAVPGALLMGLMGFVCVSMVRDRRVWLAAFASLLWLGQAGIQVVPQVAYRLSHNKHARQQFGLKAAEQFYLKNSSRLRCDVEGTRYISLLHHLAGIPQCKTFSTIAQGALNAVIGQGRASANTQGHPQEPARMLQAVAAFERCSLDSSLKCPASGAGKSISFSPAFIFIRLARGPPEHT